MLAQVHSFILQGIEPLPCEIEVDVAERGLSKITIVGLADTAVKESIERVRSAMINSGYPFPMSRLLVSLAPADLKKEGPIFDLPIAVGLLLAEQVIQSPRHRRMFFAGELALDGRVRPVNGIINLAILARRENAAGLVVPLENADEAAAASADVPVYPVDSLSTVVSLLNEQLEMEPHPPVDYDSYRQQQKPAIDFADVRGQEAVKRAVTIAAAGAHNLIMVGPAGTGKTMMAKALPGILPPLSHDEALDVTRIYSSVGLLPHGGQLIATRPVRTPHHTSSTAAMIGGGSIPKPGEISLAHRGVLFLDEMPEFPRAVLETMRQPLEDGQVTVARSHSSVKFPAQFMLVAAMNPTPKGDMPDDEASQQQMRRYLARLSGPLIDRVDIHVEVPAIPAEQLMHRPRGTDSASMAKQVIVARKQQHERMNHAATFNASLSGKQLDELAPMTDPAKRLLQQALSELGLSARAYDKVRRVARTIADLEQQATLDVAHVAEAIGYRLLDKLLQ